MPFLNPALFFLSLDVICAASQSVTGFYPFGKSNGDKVAPFQQNTKFKLPSAVKFAGSVFSSINITEEDDIAFSQNLFISPIHKTFDHNAIEGTTYCRISQDKTLLNLGISDAKKAFPNLVILKDFKPTSAFIVTWYKYAHVGDYPPDYSSFGTTFQIGLFWSSTRTLLFMNYNYIQTFYVPIYGIISDLTFDLSGITSSSNMASKGKHGFRVDSKEVRIPTSLKVDPPYVLIPGFYPFGVYTGDRLLLSPQSSSILLPKSPKIRDLKRSRVTLDQAGVFSFTPAIKVAGFTMGLMDGRIYYSLSTRSDILKLAKSDASKSFPNIPAIKAFNPTHVLTLTAINVFQGYLIYKSINSIVVTAQTVLFWDSKITIMCSNFNEFNLDARFPTNAFVGDEELPLFEGMQAKSNMGVAGKYCYRIDSKYVQIPTKNTQHPFPPLQMIPSFLPYGVYRKDKFFLPVGFSTSGSLDLPERVKILNKKRSRFIVTASGKLLFSSKLVLAPFTTRSSTIKLLAGPLGKVFYRTTQQKSVINGAKAYIKKGFPSLKFSPQNAILATWYLAPYTFYYNEYGFGEMELSELFSVKNSFQAIVIWDKSYTFTCFIYDYLQIYEPYNYVGILFGGYIGKFEIYVDSNFRNQSNIGMAGKYCYRIDSTVLKP